MTMKIMMKTKKMPDATRRQTNNTTERDVKYIAVRKNLEDDAKQIHTDGDKSGDNLEPKKRRSSRNVNKPEKYGGDNTKTSRFISM